MSKRVRDEPASLEYTIRPYRPGDRDGFLDLYEAVWNRRKGRRWFSWRFEANPYADGVSMVVAVADGRVVGAEPCVPFRVRAGDRVVDALQPADWIVHPDYRRQGVFTAMTERWIDRATDETLFFNFPTTAITSGLADNGWRDAGRPRTFYRIQRPEAVALAVDAPQWQRLSSRIGGHVARGYLWLRDCLRTRDDGLCVDRYDETPVDVLRTLYRESVPDRTHVLRDGRYYAWRFANPRWDCTSYVARKDGEPVAAVVACRLDTGEFEKVTVADVQPMTDWDREGVRAGLAACLGALCRDSRDVALVDAAADVFPTDVLARAGFVPDDRFPVTEWKPATTLMTRPTPGDAAVFDDLAVTDVDDWCLSLGERDIA